jgi:hypothetical protein
MDEEQRRDFEYLNQFPNRSGRIRECVRAMRLGMVTQQIVTYTIPESEEMDMLEEVSEMEALDLLTS